MYNTDPSEVPDEVDSSVPDGSQLERDSGDARPAGGAGGQPEPEPVTVSTLELQVEASLRLAG